MAAGRERSGEECIRVKNGRECAAGLAKGALGYSEWCWGRRGCWIGDVAVFRSVSVLLSPRSSCQY